MGRMGHIIAASAAKHPDLALDTTECLSYFVAGVTEARTVLRGKLDADAPDIDFSAGGEAISNAMEARYGKGFGVPWRQDMTVLPAISHLPDEHSNNYGWRQEENFEPPNASTLALLGWEGPLSQTDTEDMKACSNFAELVIKPLNRGLPVGSRLPSAAIVPDTGGAQVHASASAAIAAQVKDGAGADAHSVLVGGFVVSVLFTDPRENRPGFTGVKKGSQRATGSNLTPSLGCFWFFTDDSRELFVKILANRYIYIGALTDVGWTMTVADASGKTVYSYHNADGHALGVAADFG